MRDFRDAKAMAQTLREALKDKSVSLTHSESLELVAKTLGFHDWNVLAARIQSERQPPAVESATVVPASAGEPVPLIPLRDVVIFPRAIMPLFVGREKSKRAVEQAMASDARILAVTQRRIEDDDPAAAALYRVGVTASIIHHRTLADGNSRIIVEAAERIAVERVVVSEGDFISAKIVTIVEQRTDTAEALALLRAVSDTYRNRVGVGSATPPQALAHLAHITHPGALADAVAQLLTMPIEQKQDLLETADVVARLEKILDLMKVERPPT
jgi:ATP-dependent Lon protease